MEGSWMHGHLMELLYQHEAAHLWTFISVRVKCHSLKSGVVVLGTVTVTINYIS